MVYKKKNWRDRFWPKVDMDAGYGIFGIRKNFGVLTELLGQNFLGISLII
jgi:hypothetical protein